MGYSIFITQVPNVLWYLFLIFGLTTLGKFYWLVNQPWCPNISQKGNFVYVSSLGMYFNFGSFRFRSIWIGNFFFFLDDETVKDESKLDKILNEHDWQKFAEYEQELSADRYLVNSVIYKSKYEWNLDKKFHNLT